MFDDVSPLPEVDLLVVAPHPDDAEIGCGGLLLHARSIGLRTGILDLTSGEPTPRGTPERRAAETAAATALLKPDLRLNLGLPNRNLEPTLEHRRALASVFRRTRPKTLFITHWEDAHPDHLAATELVETARFWSKLSRSDIPGEPWHPSRVFYYFGIHIRNHPRPAFVLDISEHIDTKMAAIRCYESQFLEGRPNTFPTPLDDIRDRARYWGWSIGRPYGEPFCSREEVGVSSLAGLLL